MDDDDDDDDGDDCDDDAKILLKTANLQLLHALVPGLSRRTVCRQ